MDRLWIIFGFSVVYIIVTTVVGMWSVKKTKDTESFMTAKNQMSTWVIGILLMSEFIGSGATIGTAQGAYEKGMAVAWNCSTLALGYLLYSYMLAPKMNALGEYTISGALAHHYGNGVKMVVSVAMAIALTTVCVAVYTGGASAIAALLHIPIENAVYMIAVAATLNVSFGGLRGVGYANIIHTAFKFLGLIILCATAWIVTHNNPQLLTKIPETHYSLFAGVKSSQLLAWTVGNIGAVFSTQYVLQSICSLPNPAQARKATIVAGLAIFPIGFLAAYIGVMATAIFPGIKSVMAMPAYFDIMNPWLVGIVTASIIASTFVSILACQLGATALMIKDFYVPYAKPNEKKKIWATRIMSIIIGLIPIPFALGVPGMIKTFFFARALRSSITVLLLFMIFAPLMTTKTGGTVALVLSLIGTITWMILGNPYGIDNIYVAIVIPTVVILLDYAFNKMKQTSNPQIENQ
ncbi:sodium:solute symporter family protein [Sporomusa acidovorans]|uniref:Sodium/glucose cotransporter n=1 Tax=Sporomusa acidovorans (strain ATCC 49682 / DSM 3132 / Mol) TaxID=1123286 RepID=A0ABZ3J824_SPOA4|nr:sodium:solute symporter family protein [Sporomusa acidovorans]OZC16707.1 sodium/glucose cotransporter [Sporomusa acidovorans DSM 3132]SDE05206.1 solute:Na+ symporter, SSS family [Sporomusa acidovorans]